MNRAQIFSSISRHPRRRPSRWHWFGPALLLAAGAAMYGGAVLAVLLR